jgi:demethylmacrocin O-methyltransferase
MAYFVSDNLTTLAKIYRSDKCGRHFYTPHYQNHFKKFRYKRINFLEIGVGGGEEPFAGVNSLRMLKQYFPFEKKYSIDIYDKSPQEERRIKIFEGCQVDELFLASICDEIGEFELIIDDGSHINSHVIKSFEFLFAKLKTGGIYVIEDAQTSYWDYYYGGTSKNFHYKGRKYNHFKSLNDALNHQEFVISGCKKSYFDKHIVAMHFYHNMIFIYKAKKDEPSNYLVNNMKKNG